jgi:hypothetical protein
VRDAAGISGGTIATDVSVTERPAAAIHTARQTSTLHRIARQKASHSGIHEEYFQTPLRPQPRGRKRRADALHEQLWPLNQAVNSAGLH